MASVDLIGYGETPQVTGLEYSEPAFLKKHPEYKDKFDAIANGRKIKDHTAREHDLRGIRSK